MKNDYALFERMPMPDYDFPIKCTCTQRNDINGLLFSNHWHPHLELLYFVEGNAIIECNSEPIRTKPGDLIVVNSNDLHQGTCISNNLKYYCIILDTSILHSQSPDACDTKYITPISQNYILFKNIIQNNQEICTNIEKIISELQSRNFGFELATKSYLYKLLVLLLRNHLDKILTEEEFSRRRKNLERFNPIFKYIETNFNEKIYVEDLANRINLSVFHFSRLFKNITDKTPNEYINYIRINKAESMLKYSNMNVSEVAMSCGFSDINYFSRLFKKTKHVSPSSLIKKRNTQ